MEVESELEFTVEDISLPMLKSNFETFKQELILSVEQFKIEVTEDNLPQAKKMMASLNKIKANIKEKQKETLAVFKKPTEGFNEQIKELELICDTSRADISLQVQRFEDETRKQCEQLVIKLINDLRGDYKVRKQFFNTNSSDFIKLTAITAKGGLVKTTKESIDYHIKKEQMNQIMWDGRIQESFVECTKSGIEPFNESAISHLLLLDQDEFRAKLKLLIDGELERNKKIKEKAESDIRKRVEEEERAKIREEEKKKAKEESDKLAIENESKRKAIEEQKSKEIQTSTPIEKIVEKPIQLERIETPTAKIQPKQDTFSESRNELLQKIYPSSLPRIFKCPNSRHAPEMNIREDFAGTNEGRALHKFTERWLTESIEVKTIIGEVEDFYDVDVAYLCWNVIKMLMKYRPHLKRIEVEKKIQANISSGFISGYIDIIGWLDDRRGVIIDLKAGYSEDKYDEQLKSYALAEFKNNSIVEQIVIVTIYSASMKETILKINRADSNSFEREVAQVYTKDQYTVGKACNYCPLRIECKAKELSTYNVIKILTGEEMTIIDPTLYERVLLAEKAIKKYKELFKQEVESKGEIRIGLDTYYIDRTTKEKVQLSEESFKFLHDNYQEKMIQFMKLSETNLKDFIMRDVKVGLKTAEWKYFFDDLSKRGFTAKETDEKLSKK